MAHFVCRLAEPADLPVLADLRWRLKTDDAPIADHAAYNEFVAKFVDFEMTDRTSGEVFHWVADSGGRIIAAMSVIVVRKVPEPGDLDGQWGYLTNCYALPEARNSGFGSGLLAAIKSWAIKREFELLLVWPSDRAFPFYKRAGFLRPHDPLVLDLTSGSTSA